MQEKDRAELRKLLLELKTGGAWSAGVGISAVRSRRAAFRLVPGKGALVEIVSGGRCEQLFVEAKEWERPLRYRGSLREDAKSCPRRVSGARSPGRGMCSCSNG